MSKKRSQKQTKDKRLKIITHFYELKKKLMISVLAYIIVAAICYNFAEDIYYFMLDPLLQNNQYTSISRKIIYTSLTEVFFTYVKISCFVAFIICFPFFAWNIYLFARPGLYNSEKLVVVPYLVLSPILFLLGAILVYYYILPMVWKFFLSFETNRGIPIQLDAKISEYASLFMSLVIAFGLAFQLPIVLNLLARIGVIDAQWLAEKRRFAIIIIFCVAAVLTPPDIISQISLVIPMVLLYELSIFSCKWVKK